MALSISRSNPPDITGDQVRDLIACIEGAVAGHPAHLDCKAILEGSLDSLKYFALCLDWRDEGRDKISELEAIVSKPLWSLIMHRLKGEI